MRLITILAVVGGAPLVRARVCSSSEEDCSHTACCKDLSLKCYKKDDNFAGCRQSCTPGIHMRDQARFRTPWSCELVNASQPDCASDAGNCIHLGCCRSKNHRCYMKTLSEAFCMVSKPPGWIGHEIISQRPKGDASLPDGSGDGGSDDNKPTPTTAAPTTMTPHPQWQGRLNSSHYWDCRGQSCDATHLRPWNERRFVSPPEYAPMDPQLFGGSVYGEKIWMLGALSDALSNMLGPDINNCGVDNGGGGGCGQCLIVRNYAADNHDWMAVVMKKNRCSPDYGGCKDGQRHLDVAVPGFANPAHRYGNFCGNPGTTLSNQQSDVCAGVEPRLCNCSLLPVHTPAMRRMRESCELFKAWGWRSSTPELYWRPVPCPDQFVEQVRLGAAFGPRGPTTVTFYHGGNADGPQKTTLRPTVGGPKGLPKVAWIAGGMTVVLPIIIVVTFSRRLLATDQFWRPHGFSRPQHSSDEESLMHAE